MSLAFARALESIDYDEVLVELDRRECVDFPTFVRRAWHVIEPSTELKWGWATDAICEHLAAVTDGHIRRLLMNVPPGSMKSILAGVMWTAYEWGPRGMAWTRHIGTAHKQDLSTRDAMKCRRLIQSEWFQKRWPVRIVSDNNQKMRFENAATGFREAMAFGGMTGSRGDRVLIDDPHSVDDANSPTKLAADVQTFREALPSRVNNDDSAIVIIMQRLHEKDVSAVALELGYDHLCIPMRYEPDRRCSTSIGWSDPRTEPGELMFPERFPLASVEELEKSLGAYATAGQLQQRPAPREGGLFKRDWFRIVDAVPAGNRRRVRAWDLAATKKATGNNPDWTAGIKVSHGADKTFVIEGMRRFRGSPGEVSAAIIGTAALDGQPVTIRLPQDPGQAGKAQADTFIGALQGYAVVAKVVSGDKATRASPAATQAEAGNILILRTGDTDRDAWIEPFLAEVELFPAGAHDDQVDALSDAVNELALGSRYSLDAL